MIYADTELLNYHYVADAPPNKTSGEAMRSIVVNMLVDTKCLFVCINEHIQQYLQLPIEKSFSKPEWIANVVLGKVKGLTLRFRNRSALLSAWVLPADSQPIFGNMAMLAMDVVIDPQTQQLTPNPLSPDRATIKLPTIKPQLTNP